MPVISHAVNYRSVVSRLAMLSSPVTTRLDCCPLSPIIYCGPAPSPPLPPPLLARLVCQNQSTFIITDIIDCILSYFFNYLRVFSKARFSTALATFTALNRCNVLISSMSKASNFIQVSVCFYLRILILEMNGNKSNSNLQSVRSTLTYLILISHFEFSAIIMSNLD